MYLKIENYKQHGSLEINFPDSGMVLIKGPSGSGKSTVFSAIYDAMYGKERRVKPWSGGSPLIMYQLGSMEITRSRNPNSLKVLIDGHEFQNDSAEKEIAKYLNMQAHEFMACSYIKQKMANSLLDLSPADMMQFIQKLSSATIDPEEVKSEIKNKIKIRKEEVATAKAAHDQAVASFESISEEEIGPEPVKPSKPFILNDSDDLSDTTEHAKDALRSAIKEFSTIEQKKELYIKAKNSIQSAEDSLRQKEIELKKFNPADFSDEAEDVLRSEFTLLEKKTNYLNAFDKIMALAQSVYLKYPAAKNHTGKLRGFISDKIKGLDEERRFVIDQYSKAGRELDALTDPNSGMICPKCKTKLKLDNDALLEYSVPDNAADLIKELSGLMSKLDVKRRGLDGEVEFLNKVKTESAILIEGLGVDPAPEWKDRIEITKRIQEIGESISNIKNKRKEYSIVNSDFDRNLARINVFKQQLSEYDFDAGENDLKRLKNEIDGRQALINVIEQYQKSIDRYKNELEARIRHINMLEKNKKLVDAAKLKLDASLTRLAAVERSLEVANYASSLAVENKIIEINEQASVFVDKMFSDDGTVIQLTNFSTLANGEERSKIGIEITHKGQKVSSLSDFSGGEESRASLCFQLGLSELYNSPILMIDEGFTGLDPKLQDECLEVLKDISENKLVIVIEHGAPEHFFDEVIEI